MKDEYLNHKDFIESLKNPSLDIYHKVYHKNKKGPHPGVKTVKTSRLDRIEASIANLAKEMRNGFKQVNNRIDNLENDVNSFKQEVNTRLDNIEKRLDYNNLKQLPK